MFGCIFNGYIGEFLGNFFLPFPQFKRGVKCEYVFEDLRQFGQLLIKTWQLI